ncbi:MAG: tyrosine--tRNA ligase [Oscillospiraceae bacterium]|jgi:tyrosyl-tRNA synthetase|nr:tyrosine--tRNA ligase [Oscillospiraceae bacterium]
MNVLEELRARNLLKQSTDFQKVEQMLTGSEPIKFYIGFDPTADSLHIGHYVQGVVMAHLQRAGHFPICLFGGATALIGDPTGKTDMRKMLTPEQIAHNIDCFRAQMSAIVDFSEDKAQMVNNADWLSDLNYIRFLREYGVHFSVNRMLAAECYKARWERGLTFFELNYMIMQSYDFLHLNRQFGCKLQMGGDDQWSNMLSGAELCRRVDGKEVHVCTSSLLLSSEGKKMGKTENGAVWIDKNRTSPYDFYQYWRNLADANVINCMKMLTFLPLEQIAEYESLSGSALNEAKALLAFEATKLIHGEENAQKAQDAARSLFAGGAECANLPSTALTASDFTDGGTIDILTALTRTGLAKSRGEARRLIDQGGVFADDKKIDSVAFAFAREDLQKSPVLLKKGKKGFHQITTE